MERNIKNFGIPYYIVEEVVEYIEETAKGKCKCMKWENIKALLSLSVVNKRITREDANFLIEQFCRENKE